MSRGQDPRSTNSRVRTQHVRVHLNLRFCTPASLSSTIRTLPGRGALFGSIVSYQAHQVHRATEIRVEFPNQSHRKRTKCVSLSLSFSLVAQLRPIRAHPRSECLNRYARSQSSCICLSLVRSLVRIGVSPTRVCPAAFRGRKRHRTRPRHKHGWGPSANRVPRGYCFYCLRLLTEAPCGLVPLLLPMSSGPSGFPS